jgi:hypothetical protein
MVVKHRNEEQEAAAGELLVRMFFAIARMSLNHSMLPPSAAPQCCVLG